jgi:hypothetical protein
VTHEVFPIVPAYMVRAEALLEAADYLASKDHRDDIAADDPHDRGWGRALSEAEHRLRQRAQMVLDEAEGIER